MPTPSIVSALRVDALNRLAGLNPVRVPGRKEMYRCADGTTFRLRTAPKGSLMTKADGPDAAAPMRIEGDHDFVVVSTPGRNGGPTEVYRIPTPRVVGDLRDNHAAFAATHPDASDLRAIAFGGDPASNGRGYREKYREFLLLPDINGAPTVPNADHTGESPLERALKETARAASAEYGQPIDRIRISIGVMFRSGEVVFNWGPMA